MQTNIFYHYIFCYNSTQTDWSVKRDFKNIFEWMVCIFLYIQTESNFANKTLRIHHKTYLFNQNCGAQWNSSENRTSTTNSKVEQDQTKRNVFEWPYLTTLPM